MSDAARSGELFDSGRSAEAVPIEAHAAQAYLGYAVSTVRARALPEIADGLKPVQRRILYAMAQLRAPGFAKCARYVGEVLGKYHPHGDASTYEALVHLAQPFAMRYPLIEGQGNFGSRDGDAPAAYRYTEARLAPVAELVLGEIGEGTVDFVKNYDGKAEEPVVLPARLPFGLLNGAFGIPVGYSTRIPPHNLGEVAAAAAYVIEHRRATLDEVLARMPGPDFPGGGQIISPPEEIRAAYATGRGSLLVRARWHVEPLARGQWRLVVTELPHGVSCRQVLEEIEALTDPRPAPGRREPTAEQWRLRQFLLERIESVRDESDRRTRLRLVIEPRSSRQSPDETMNLLLVHTSLETRVPVNLTWIGLDGLPETKDLLTILCEWGEFRIATVRRRTEHRLRRCEERLHLVLGRLLVGARIEEVIRWIRAAEDVAEAKTVLREKLRLSERQAEDIVSLRLGQLTKLDGARLAEERKALEAERRSLRALLAEDKALRRLVVEELAADAQRWGDARRTLIESAGRARLERAVVDEPVTVILSRKGWMRARAGHGLDPSTVSFKDGDGRYQELECRTTDTLIVLSASGRSFALEVAALPSGRGDGAPVNTLVHSGAEDIVWIGAGAPETPLVVATSAGRGFRCRLGDLVSKTRHGKEFLAVAQGARALPAIEVSRATHLAALSSDARLLVFALAEVPLRPKGGVGVQLMALPESAQLAALAACDGKRVVVSGVRRGRRTNAVLEGAALAAHLGRRAQRGRRCDPGFRPEAVGAA